MIAAIEGVGKVAITIIATPGDANTNSFATEAQAIARAATRLNLVGWVTVTGTTCAENEKAALIEAQRELNVLRYQGFRVTTTQALAFPRFEVPNPEIAYASSIGFYDPTVIPQILVDANIELAFEFLKAGKTDIAAIDDGIGIIRNTVGPLTTEWAAPSQRAQGLARFPRVLNLIAPLLLVGAGQVRLTR